MTVDGRSVGVAAGRDRAVLAMLLLHAGRTVGVAEMIEAVWYDDPPPTARGQLQTCVSRLRRALPAGTIETDPAGYRIRPQPDDVDALVFERLVAAARDKNDPALFRQALDLWRGPALAEIESPPVRRAAAALDERRLAAIEDRAGIELARDRAPRELIGELSTLVAEFPLRERLRGLLMTALFRQGRQADALAEFRRARAVLRDELGIDPGRELTELHARILNGDLPEPRTGVVRCLPRTVSDFSGRSAVVDRLVRAVAASDPGAPAIAVIDGMAGSGKTTLALHLAALLSERYPDAHLFLDLQGHSSEQPLEPAAALLILLRQLGIAAEKIPAAYVERVALWRTEMSGRRLLVLFDNAAASGQIADLLPTSPGSLALVTSRRRLTGLDGVHPESLDVLDPDEAVDLLARIAGDRVRAEPEKAAEVAHRCGGLPLAIRLAGARLAHRPSWRVSDLARRLAESALPELVAEDRTVANAFALSYRQLGDPARRLFRLLGLHPGTDFDVLGVAALAGLSAHDAEAVLDGLVDVHLVDEPTSGIYRMHDLLREFASTLAATIGAGDRAEALRHLLDHEMHAAAATVPPALQPHLMDDLRVGAPLRPDLLDKLDDPAARLERERTNLMAYLEVAVTADLPEYAWRIARAAWRHLWYGGDLDDVDAQGRRALQVTESIGNRTATAIMLNYAASASARHGAVDEAITFLRRAIGLRQELGETAGATISMGNLAVMYEVSGRWTEAIELAAGMSQGRTHPKDLQRDTNRLNVLGLSCFRLGRYAEALRYHRLRLLVVLDIRDPRLIGDALQSIVATKYRGGVIGFETAYRQMSVALRLLNRSGYASAEVDGRAELAGMLRDQGRFADAIAELRRALTQAEWQGERIQQSQLRCALATTTQLAGDVAGARELYESSLAIATELRVPYLIADARRGLESLGPVLRRIGGGETMVA
ncbi:AfsR family transcriptional regulator [Actinoplanes sp. TBRC 11911]|uniref:AfsR/SARP family transcriptional regulator n=1 Tax=Actinoplanes sp. TBRC 11911 TaxID=2729386 RepID=UPI00145D2805|nr:AfsR/SARP family transcriptional regulator [Actinoplanes sp. TBRC 11911]NMO52101.1 AfsR family transcriptional regulator [Actinoplanes sp. TBRC 11911]